MVAPFSSTPGDRGEPTAGPGAGPGRATGGGSGEDDPALRDGTDHSSEPSTAGGAVRRPGGTDDEATVTARAAGGETALTARGTDRIARPVERWQVPISLEIATALAWRAALIAAAAAAVLYLLGMLAAVVTPVVLALIAASLLAPEAHSLSRLRYVPHALASAVVVAGGVAVVSGVFYAVALAFVAGLPQLTDQLTASFGEIQNWMRTGPLGLNNQQFDTVTAELLRTLQESQASLAQSALGAVSTVGEVLTELLLALFTLIFFVYDGGAVWRFVLLAVPRSVRPRTDVAGRRAFASLVGYTRAIAVVAFIDAVTAGVGLSLIGVPLAVPLAALIFFGAFVPTLGAVVSGAVAALVALVSGGVTDMLLVALLLLAVQNLEGYVLQPLLLGKSIKLHPLAVVLPIACGLVIAGIAGALLAVPLVTVVDTGVRSLVRRTDDGLDPAAVDPLDPRSARPEWVVTPDTRPLVRRLRERWRARRRQPADVTRYTS